MLLIITQTVAQLPGKNSIAASGRAKTAGVQDLQSSDGINS
jgi:hypothetical protein